MDLKVEKEAEGIAEAVADVIEEIELACEEGATLEDIEGAKAMAADLLDRYENLLKRLGPEDRTEMQKRIGLAVEKVKGKLTQLKEAPE